MVAVRIVYLASVLKKDVTKILSKKKYN